MKAAVKGLLTYTELHKEHEIEICRNEAFLLFQLLFFPLLLIAPGFAEPLLLVRLCLLYECQELIDKLN